MKVTANNGFGTIGLNYWELLQYKFGKNIL